MQIIAETRAAQGKTLLISMLKVFITLRITFLPFIYVNAACGYAPWLSMPLKPEIARLLRHFCACDLVRRGEF